MSATTVMAAATGSDSGGVELAIELVELSWRGRNRVVQALDLRRSKMRKFLG